MKADNGIKRKLPALRSQRSFTLVEVLVALALTTLVVSLTGRIAVQTLTTRKAVTRIAARLERDAVVLDRLAQDLSNLLPGLPDDKSPLLLLGDRLPVLQLSALTTMPGHDDSLHLTRYPATVRYRLTGRRGEPGGLTLVRETIDRTDRAAIPRRETIATGVKELSMEILTDGDSYSKYPPASGQASASGYAPARGHTLDPWAVRVTLRWIDSERSWTRTLPVPHAR